MRHLGKPVPLNLGGGLAVNVEEASEGFSFHVSHRPGSVWLGGVSERVLVWAEQPRVASQPGPRSLGICRLPVW